MQLTAAMKDRFFQSDRVLYAFRKAPDIFADAIDYWMNQERNRFLGRKLRSSDKGIRGKLYHKEIGSGSMGWPKNYVSQFKSFKKNKGNIDLTMIMGLTQDDGRVTKALEFMAEGGTNAPGKYMIVPNLSALKYYGVYKQTQAEEFFKNKKSEMQFVPSKDNDNTFFMVSKNPAGEAYIKKYGAPQSAQHLLFTITKRTRVHKQFNFMGTWNRNLPRVMSRGQKMMDRATRKVENLIKTGEISVL